jgi:hypothetical protein
MMVEAAVLAFLIVADALALVLAEALAAEDREWL